jgi:hypothetical protein
MSSDHELRGNDQIEVYAVNARLVFDIDADGNIIVMNVLRDVLQTVSFQHHIVDGVMKSVEVKATNRLEM